MLEQLLAEIQSGGTLETSELAARLGTTPMMVEAMLENLQRTGHIRLVPSCTGGCNGCGLKKICQAGSSTSQVRIWQGSVGINP